MPKKFTVSAELTANDLASPVVKRARDAYADLGAEVNKTLRDASRDAPAQAEMRLAREMYDLLARDAAGPSESAS